MILDKVIKMCYTILFDDGIPQFEPARNCRPNVLYKETYMKIEKKNLAYLAIRGYLHTTNMSTRLCISNEEKPILIDLIEEAGLTVEEVETAVRNFRCKYNYTAFTLRYEEEEDERCEWICINTFMYIIERLLKIDEPFTRYMGNKK